MTKAQDREWILKKIASIFGPKAPSYIGENNVVAVEWGRYTIRFDARDPVIHLQQLLTAIGRAEARISAVAGLAPPKLAIQICRTEEELYSGGAGRSAVPGWVGGAFDGTIRVLSDPQNEKTPHSLYVFLTHEMVHAALGSTAGHPLPGWFEEGLAVYLSQNLPLDYLRALEEALRGRRLLPLADLEGPFARLDGGRVPLAYAQAASLMEFLIERVGLEKLGLLIARAKRRGFAAMLKGESLTPSLLEQDWKRWAARHLKAAPIRA